MNDNEFAERNRAIKVERISAHILTVHHDLKANGVLGDFSVPHEWVRHPLFPFDALVRASGAKPASDKTRALVLDELRRAA